MVLLHRDAPVVCRSRQILPDTPQWPSMLTGHMSLRTLCRACIMAQDAFDLLAKTSVASDFNAPACTTRGAVQLLMGWVS